MLEKRLFEQRMRERYASRAQLSPTLNLRFGSLTPALQHKIVLFYRSRAVPPENFQFSNSSLLVYSEPHYSRLKSLLPSDHVVIAQAPYPNTAASDQMREIAVFAAPRGCGMGYAGFLRECELLRTKFVAASPLLVLDFEAFSTSPELSISEAAICRVGGASEGDFHAFVECAGPYNEAQAAVAGIPAQRMAGQHYASFDEIAAQIPPDALLFARGTDLERRVLRQKMHIRREVFEIKSLAALFGHFDAQPAQAQRCSFHATAPGHCALEDAGQWKWVLRAAFG